MIVTAASSAVLLWFVIVYSYGIHSPLKYRFEMQILQGHSKKILAEFDNIFKFCIYGLMILSQVADMFVLSLVVAWH